MLVTNQHFTFLKGIFVGKTGNKVLTEVFGKVPELEPRIITFFGLDSISFLNKLSKNLLFFLKISPVFDFGSYFDKPIFRKTD